MMMGASILAERIIKPSRFRRQHGPVARVAEQIADVDGNIGDPFRGLSLLEQWQRSGRITKAMLDAGNEFNADFYLACLDPIHAADMARIGGARGPVKHMGCLRARDRVRDALAALGGPESPAGCGAWFVLGCEFSIRQWAEREGWRGRRLNDHVAAGILIGSLGTLAKHYGY